MMKLPKFWVLGGVGGVGVGVDFVTSNPIFAKLDYFQAIYNKFRFSGFMVMNPKKKLWEQTKILNKRAFFITKCKKFFL